MPSEGGGGLYFCLRGAGSKIIGRWGKNADKPKRKKENCYEKKIKRGLKRMIKCPFFKFAPAYTRADLLSPAPVRCCGTCIHWEWKAGRCEKEDRLGKIKI